MRRLFLPDRPRLLPALLAGAGALVLNVLWIVTGSAWLSVAAYPLVWISMRHVGLHFFPARNA